MILYSIVVATISADGLVPLCAKSFADSVMAQLKG